MDVSSTRYASRTVNKICQNISTYAICRRLSAFFQRQSRFIMNINCSLAGCLCWIITCIVQLVKINIVLECCYRNNNRTGKLAEISSIIIKEIVTNDIFMGSFSLFLRTSAGFYSNCLRSL
jgi:hypothetical protein